MVNVTVTAQMHPGWHAKLGMSYTTFSVAFYMLDATFIYRYIYMSVNSLLLLRLQAMLCARQTP